MERKIGENEYEFSGRVEIEHINEKFDLDIKESESYHTIAGYILDNLESLPSQGDVFELGDLKFTILNMSAARIELIKVERKKE